MSRVSFLMCPFCVRGLLTNATTDLGALAKPMRTSETGRSWLGCRGRRGRGEPLGNSCRVDTTRDVELAEDVRDVGARCLGADDELGGDLSIRIAAAEQLEYLALTRGQPQRVRLGRGAVSILRSKPHEVEPGAL